MAEHPCKWGVVKDLELISRHQHKCHAVRRAELKRGTVVPLRWSEIVGCYVIERKRHERERRAPDRRKALN